MKQLKKSLLSLAGLGLGLEFCISASAAITPTEIRQFLGKLAADDPEGRRIAAAQAHRIGARAVLPLGDMAGSTNQPMAVAALQALRNITLRSALPDAESRPAEIAAALLKLTTPDRPRRVRTEALHLVSLAGGDEVVSRIAALLGDAEVRDDARMALERIPGETAGAALLDAQAGAEGDFRLQLIHSIGQKATPAAHDGLLKIIERGDSDVSLAAYEGLSHLGSGPDEEMKRPEFETMPVLRRERLALAWLRWAEHRLGAGDRESAFHVYSTLHRNARREHVLCAALLGLAKTDSAPFPSDAVDALNHEANSVRQTARNILLNHRPDAAAVRRLKQTRANADEEKRALLDEILAAWEAKPR